MKSKNGESKGKAQRRPIGAALKAQRVVEQHVGARMARRSMYIESREGRDEGVRGRHRQQGWPRRPEGRGQEAGAARAHQRAAEARRC